MFSGPIPHGLIRLLARLVLFLVPLLMVNLAPAMAAEKPVYTGLLNNLGAGGYDVVSYFAGTPAEGKKEFETSWNGAEWRFATAANRDLFLKTPEKYAPQFGGYCSWAVSQGYTAPGDPEVWSIVDGKLYLNYDKDVQTRWNKDIPGFIAAANKNWPTVLSK